MLVTQEQRRFAKEMHLPSPMIKGSDATRILNISNQRLAFYRKKQLVSCIRVGGRWRYLLDSLQRLKRNYLKLSPKEKLIARRIDIVSDYKIAINEINKLSLEDKLNISTKDLPLSTKLKKQLSFNTSTVKDIVMMTKGEYGRIPGIGCKFMNELEAFLNNIGLSFGMKFDK